MIDFLAKGGILVVPILLCSVVALAIFLERLIHFSMVGIRDFGLVEKVARYVKDGEPALAIELARGNKSPMARILASVLEVIDHDRETF